jgi:hypothetical protein
MLRRVGTLLSATRRSRILLGVAAPVLTLILILILLEISYRQEEAREASLLSTGSISSSSPRADHLKLILEPDDAQRAPLAQAVIPVAPIGPTDLAEPSPPEPTQGSPQVDVAARDPVPLPRSRPNRF